MMGISSWKRKRAMPRRPNTKRRLFSLCQYRLATQPAVLLG